MTHALLLTALLFLSLDLNGKWKGSMSSPNGEMDVSMVLKIDGDKVTGTVTNMYGEEQITEGKVSGDDISFIVLAGGGQFKIVYVGKVEGDHLRFKVTIGDFGDGELIAKRP